MVVQPGGNKEKEPEHHVVPEPVTNVQIDNDSLTDGASNVKRKGSRIKDLVPMVQGDTLNDGGGKKDGGGERR